MSDEEKMKLLADINKRKILIEDPLIQFTYKYLPKEKSSDLDLIPNSELNSKKLKEIVAEFNEEWDTAVLKLEEYKNYAEGNEISKDEIINDIQIFVNSEQEKCEEFIKHVDSELGKMSEETQAEVSKELQAYKNLYNIFVQNIKTKMNAITEQDDITEIIFEEINKNIEWLLKQKMDSENKLKIKIESRIKIISTYTAVALTEACNEVEKKIILLEDKLKEKKLEIEEMRFLKLKAQLSAEIQALRSRKSYLDLRKQSLIDLENALKELDEELRQELEYMNETEIFFKNEIEKTLTNPELSGEEKLERLEKFKEEFDKGMYAHKKLIKSIELKREEIKRALLDEFELQMNLKQTTDQDLDEIDENLREDIFPDNLTYEYDEFGRYFIDIQGRKIYREDDNAKAYIIDEFGNFVEIPIPQKGFEGPVRLEDNEYLKKEVGEALVKGLALAVLYRPLDPILYLAHFILKFRKNIDLKKQRQEERNIIAMQEERETSAKRDTSPRNALWGEDGNIDFNMRNYETPLYINSEQMFSRHSSNQ